MSDVSLKNDFYRIYQQFMPQLDEQSWLRDVREQALNAFQQVGLPTKRTENWKYTSTRFLADIDFTLGLSAVSDRVQTLIEKQQLRLDEQYLVCFVNGYYVSELSDELPNSIGIQSLGEVLKGNEWQDYLENFAIDYQYHPFSALNTSFMRDGVVIDIPKDICLDKPIQCLFATVGNGQDCLAYPRVLVRSGDNSHCTLIENHIADEDGQLFSNVITQLELAQGSKLNHIKINQESNNTHHIAGIHVRQHADSEYHSSAYAIDGKLVRNDIDVELLGKGAYCSLNGLYLVNEGQHVDYHTRINHAVPHCKSHELYKGVLADHSRAVFNGKIVVQPQAQKTDSKQYNKNLLLAANAEVDTKPELEIYADDVKCAHGATIGQIDEEAIFYFAARGIDTPTARQMLIHAFAQEVMNSLDNQAIQKELQPLMDNKMNRLVTDKVGNA